MAEGDELPPVVATLEGDDSGFLAMLERDVEAARAFAADLQAALEEGMGGITLSGSQITSEGVGAAGEIIGEQLAAGIEEGAGGLDLRAEMEAAVSGSAEAGQLAGSQMAEGVEESFGAVSAAITTDLAEAGAAGGDALAEAIVARGAAVGEVLAQNIGEQLRLGLDEAAQATMGVLGHINAAGIGGTIAASLAGADLLAGLGGVLTAGLSDVAAEAGSAAGGALMGGLADSAKQGAPGVAAAAGAAVQAPLGDAMEAAGDAAGVRYAEGLQRGISSINIPLGGLDLSTLSGAGPTGPDPFVQDPSAPSRSVRQSILAQEQAVRQAAADEAKAAADSMRAALIDAFGSSGWQISGEQFAQLTDAGVAEWQAEVEAQAAAVGGGFAQDFAAALREQFSALDWSTLSEVQAAALTDALTSTAAAAGEASGAAAGQGLVTGIEAVLASDEAFLRAAADAGMAQPLIAAVQDLRAGIEADLSEIPAELTGAFEGISERFAQEGASAGTAYALALQESLNAQAATLRPPTMSAGSPNYVDLTANLEQWEALQGKVSGEAGATAGEIGKVGAAADGAAGAVGGMAGIMGGPLMFGLMGAASMLPMVAQAFQSSAINAATFTAAVAQDSGAVGDNTAATIQNALAKTDLNSMAQNLGVTQAQLIEYAAGEADAQNAVAEAYKRVDDYEQAHASNAVAGLREQKAQLDQVTASVAQAIEQERANTDTLLAAENTTQIYNATVGNLVSTMRQQAEQARMSADATGAYLMGLVPGTQAYTNAVDDQVIALRQSAITTEINNQALNDSIAPQGQLSKEALAAADAYQEASGATGLYTTALTALYGQYGTTSNALAGATQAVDNLTGKITSGKDAVNLYSDAGSKNFQQFESAAQAAETYAEKVYQTTQDSDQATKALQDFAGKIDHAATEAGLTKTQVQELNTELFGVPDVKDITIHLDKTPAEQQMSELDSFIAGEIADINNTPITPGVSGRMIQARAGGGPVLAGTPYVVGELGRPELFVPGSDGFITPMDMLQPATAGGGGAYSGAGAVAPAPQVNVYIDGRLVTAGVRSSSQQYDRRNSTTGLGSSR